MKHHFRVVGLGTRLQENFCQVGEISRDEIHLKMGSDKTSQKEDRAFGIAFRIHMRSYRVK